MPDMFSFRFEPDRGLERKIDGALREAQGFIDSECLRLSNEKAPFDQHTLIESGVISSGGGKITWNTPYARRHYYMPANFSKEKNPEAGNYWFERMKQQYREEILRGAQKVIAQNL